MHPGNTAEQNTEISEALTRIEAAYSRAVRLPNIDRGRLSEGLGEILWKGRNLPYRQAFKLLRHAEISFSEVAFAQDVGAAMERFTVRPDEDRRWVRAPRSVVRSSTLPRGAIVLIPAQPGARRSFAVAA